MEHFKFTFFILTVLFFALSIKTSFAGELPAYRIFDEGGGKEDFDDLLDDALDADIIFFGELHNNPISHWLQYELAKNIYNKMGKRLIIGAEMFECDDQIKIDEYFSGQINQSNFEKESKLWNNYKTDYKPLLEFAKDSGLKYIATNIPRRYASLVSRKGLPALEQLGDEAKKLFPPLPIEMDMELPNYKKMKEDMKGSHGADYIAEAQAVKDATMAYFILKYIKEGGIFLHLNGTYHSNNYEGIVWFIKRAAPNLKILTIATTEQENLKKLDEKNEELADYIIVTPLKMTKTY